MKQALGLVEIEGLTTAVVVADTMAKAANIQILDLENTKGLGYMTIKIAGDVGAVTAAVTAGKQIGMINNKLVSWKVIARPSDYVEQTFCDPGSPTPAPPQDSQPQTASEPIVETGTEPAAEIPAEPVAEVQAEPAAEVPAGSDAGDVPEPAADPEKPEKAAKKSKPTKGKK